LISVARTWFKVRVPEEKSDPQNVAFEYPIEPPMTRLPATDDVGST